MRNKTTKTTEKPTPRTNLRWRKRDDYNRALKACGHVPLATWVMSLVLYELERRAK